MRSHSVLFLCGYFLAYTIIISLVKILQKLSQWPHVLLYNCGIIYHYPVPGYSGICRFFFVDCNKHPCTQMSGVLSLK